MPRLALHSQEAWFDLGSRAKSLWFPQLSNSCRLYQGLRHAVHEVVFGTAQFLSHKRAIAYHKYSSPHLEQILPLFLRDSFQVQSLSEREIESPAETMSSLRKETSLVAMCADHPVEDRQYSVHEFRQLLSEKKIFSFTIYHRVENWQPRELLPFEVELIQMAPGMALVMAGSRFKTPPLLAPDLAGWTEDFWNQMQIIHHDWVKWPDVSVRKTWVENLEARPPKGFRSVPPTGRRGFSQLVMVADSASGAALRDQLLNEIQKVSAGEKISDHWVETPNLCRWKGYGLYSGWWEPRPTDFELSRWVILDPALHVVPQIEEILVLANQRCQLRLGGVEA